MAARTDTLNRNIYKDPRLADLSPGLKSTLSTYLAANTRYIKAGLEGCTINEYASFYKQFNTARRKLLRALLRLEGTLPPTTKGRKRKNESR